MIPTPALPSFAELQQSAPPTQPTYQIPPSAPSGGAITPPAPALPPGGLGLTPPATPTIQAPPTTPAKSPYIAALEAHNKIPVGMFHSEAELIDRLWSVSDNLNSELEALRNQPPAAPTQQVTPTPAPAEDLTSLALPFQQSGMLAMDNGQWVARHAAATSLAQQLNQRAAEAQARTAELATDTAGFIRKYGQKAFEEALAPINQKLTQFEAYTKQLEAELARAVPKPHEQWVKQNEAQLWTADQFGRRVPSAAGAAYSNAWDQMAKYGVPDAELHQYAMTMAAPHLTQQQPAQQPAPQQSWMQTVVNNPPVINPGFTAPGTTFQSQTPPQARDAIYGNDGFPSFTKMQALPQ